MDLLKAVKQKTGLEHIVILPRGRPIWTVAQSFMRPSDIKNLRTLMTFTATTLPPTLGGYTEGDDETLKANITVNFDLIRVPMIIQAGVVMHEGRHVKWIAEGKGIWATVQGEVDALHYERDFYLSCAKNPASARRLASIEDQLSQLASQDPDEVPDIKVKKSFGEMDFTCCGLRKAHIGRKK